MPASIANAPLRTAALDDVTALVELVTCCYRGDSSRVGWTTEADLLDGERIDPALLQADITRPFSRVIVAEHDQHILACAHVCRDGDAGYFGMFAVAPRLQNSGLGTRILAECERIVAKEWQLPVLRMTVIEQRPELIAYYLRRGYGRSGEFLPFPYGDPRFGLPKRDDLRFVVLHKDLRTKATA